MRMPIEACLRSNVDMSGAGGKRKLAGRRPLDGRVRRRHRTTMPLFQVRATLSARFASAPNRRAMPASNAYEGASSEDERANPVVLTPEG